MPVSALYAGLIGNFSGSISKKGRLPVTAYRTDKWRNGKEGGAENFTQRSSDGQSTRVDFPLIIIIDHINIADTAE